MVPAETILDIAAERERVDVVGLSGLITPSLDQMVEVAKRDEAAAARAAAADRRRDDVAPAHRGEDRAGVRQTRRCTCSTRAASSTSSRALLDPARRAELDVENRELQERLRVQHAEKIRKPLLTLDGARANRVHVAVRRPAGAAVHRHAHDVEPALAELVAVHRLAVLLPRLGPEGQVPGDPRQPGGARAATTTRSALLDEITSGELAAGARRLRLLAGARRGRRRRRRRHALLLPAPAGRPRRRAARTAASPTTSRRTATTSARSPSSIHGADELAGAVRGRARRLPGDHRQGAGRPPRRGVRRVAARARAPRVVRARRAACRASDASASASAASGRRSATRPAPTTARRRKLFDLLGAEQAGHRADRELRDDAGGGRQRHLPRPSRRRSYFAVGRIGHDQLDDYARRKAGERRGSLALALAEPRLRLRRLRYPSARRRPLGADRFMRTTLKRGVGRGATANGNGRAIFPPGAISTVTRYRQPPPPPPSGVGLVGKILLGTFLAITSLGARGRRRRVPLLPPVGRRGPGARRPT